MNRNAKWNADIRKTVGMLTLERRQDKNVLYQPWNADTTVER